MRHAIPKTLVSRFRAKTGTFHLSCGEYAILPLDWMAILDLRFSGYPVPIDLVDFAIASELLGICYPFTLVRQQYFGPADEPQIRIEWLKMNIPWVAKPNDIALRRFFFYFIYSCMFGNNQSMLTCKLLRAMRVVLDMGPMIGGPSLMDSSSLSRGRLHNVVSRASKVAGRF